MERVIWKFELRIASRQSIKMPEGAEIISAQMQNDMPMIWAIVNPRASLATRKFVTLATGGNFTPERDMRFLATLQDGPFVWHLFEVG